jgi:D-3-phosphoglycerate dehydrogenase
MKNNIFIALSTFAADDNRPLEILQESGFSYKIHKTGKRITTEELLRDATDSEVIVAGVEPYDKFLLDKLHLLRCISRCGVGVDAIDLEAAREKHITVANTPTIPVQAVAELALTMFLSLSRNIVTQSNILKQGRWEKLTGHLLAGRIVGLIGFGRIGQRVAELCKAFGSDVIVFDPYVNPELAKKTGVLLVSKSQLLETADIVSLHASKTSGTKVLIGEEELNLMKQDAILVNLSRGEMVDEVALLEVLEKGKLKGVGLDVFNTEPYQGPLYKFDRVLVTPHSATLTYETRSAMEIQCIENAIAFLKGELDLGRLVI